MAPIVGTNIAVARRPLLEEPGGLLPIRDNNFSPRLVERNFELVSTWFREFGRASEDLEGTAGHSALDFLARLLGGELFIAQVANSAAADDTGDTELTHNLGRIPILVAFSWIISRSEQGSILGGPTGGLAPNANFTPWTIDKIYVRATASTFHAFILI